MAHSDQTNGAAADDQFRHDVRQFLADKLPPDLSEKVRLHRALSKSDIERWHAILNAKGWLVGNWPKKFGGQDWTPIQRHIFEDESARANAPRILPFGIAMLAPVLMKFGSHAQQERFLPRILDGRDWWCQGYSEPGAGSDLASVKTSAVREGEEFIVNGQKTWTTLGQYANWIFCLVRTDPDAAAPQQGIGFLLIDMASPGITLRPIRLIDGSVEVNEIFFDDVRVPAENLVGAPNEGWTYAKYLLTHERTNIAGIGFANASLEALKRLARSNMQNGRPLIENPLFAARLAVIEIDLMAMATTNLRMLTNAAEGQAPGPESSMLKLKGTCIRQAISDLARRAVGNWALVFPDEGIEAVPADAAGLTRAYLNGRKLSIYGGSNEIQRNIIAKQLLEI